MRLARIWMALPIITNLAVTGPLLGGPPREAAETDGSEREQDAASVTILVQGMIKSRSGAT